MLAAVQEIWGRVISVIKRVSAFPAYFLRTEECSYFLCLFSLEFYVRANRKSRSLGNRNTQRQTKVKWKHNVKKLWMLLICIKSTTTKRKNPTTRTVWARKSQCTSMVEHRKEVINAQLTRQCYLCKKSTENFVALFVCLKQIRTTLLGYRTSTQYAAIWATSSKSVLFGLCQTAFRATFLVNISAAHINFIQIKRCVAHMNLKEVWPFGSSKQDDIPYISQDKGSGSVKKHDNLHSFHFKRHTWLKTENGFRTCSR